MIGRTRTHDRNAEVCWHLGAQDARTSELLQCLFGFNGEGRIEECEPLIPFATAPTAGVHTSPASVVFVTFMNVFEAIVLPVPEPRRIPAQASLIVLPVTVLPLPEDGEHESSV